MKKLFVLMILATATMSANAMWPFKKSCEAKPEKVVKCYDCAEAQPEMLVKLSSCAKKNMPYNYYSFEKIAEKAVPGALNFETPIN